jgi:hypothetical protein
MSQVEWHVKQCSRSPVTTDFLTPSLPRAGVPFGAGKIGAFLPRSRADYSRVFKVDHVYRVTGITDSHLLSS